MKSRILVTILSFIFAVSFFTLSSAQQSEPIKLPEPKMDKSVTLMEALKNRKTSREFNPGNLSNQTLSNLLWAAWGINRSDSGRRTAPSARNRQEIDLYVVTSDGIYIYDAKALSLKPIVSGDFRALTGTQSYFKDAAINLVFVADLSRMNDRDEAGKINIASMDTGFIAQNVYLFCASEGLATVYRVSIDKPNLALTMKLSPDQRIIGAQSVGLPAKN